MELEDEAIDVIQKACRGCEIEYDSSWSLRDAAETLGLQYEALINLKSYAPVVVLPHDVKCYVANFGHIGVNSWQVGSQLFDTGTQGEVIQQMASNLTGVAITHGHPDHVGGYSAVRPFVNEAWCPQDQPVDRAEVLRHGDQCRMGNYQFTCLDVTGHATSTQAPAALAYYTENTEIPVCVIGDAVFAGSMGGCRNATQYNQLMKHVGTHIMTLPSETILLPGHGPATTVEFERRNNPFLR